MANTTSLSFPNMFNVTQNHVSILEDRAAVSNRDRLLILSEPTELYNNPNFGVGLRRHMWKYNTETERALIRDRIVDQLKLHEPYAVAEETQWVDGLVFTGNNQDPVYNVNDLEMTVGIKTTFNDTAEVVI